MKPSIEIREILFLGHGFPGFEELKAKGWQVPGKDEGLVQHALHKVIEGYRIMLVKDARAGEPIKAAIFPADPKDGGMDETTALALVASVFEEVGG